MPQFTLGQTESNGNDFNKSIESNFKALSNEDSLFLDFIHNSITIPDVPPVFNKNNFSQSDSSFRLQSVYRSMNGLIDLNYQYGLLSGYFDPETTSPLSIFNSKGDFSVEAIKIPIKVSYNYSSFINPLGINNYFRCALDTEKLKQNVDQSKQQIKNQLEEQINQLKTYRNTLTSRLGMGELLVQKYKRKVGECDEQINRLTAEIIRKDSVENNASIETPFLL